MKVSQLRKRSYLKVSQSTIDVSKICSELGGFREAQGWNKLKEILKQHW